MLLNYFKIAWRTLVKNRLYTFINVLGLSLGICACLVIYLITHFELGYEKFHPEKEKIYRIVGKMQGPTGEARQLGFVPDPVAIAARAEISGLATVSSFFNYYAKVAIPNGEKIDQQFEKPKREIPSDIIVTDPQYFDLFSYKWLAGSPNSALKDPFQLVLSEKEARKYFGPGTPDQFIGRQVWYNDSLHMIVSGIVKDWVGNTDLGFKDFISMATVSHSFLKNDIDLTAWGMWDYDSQAFVKLAPGVSPAKVERQLSTFMSRHFQPRNGDKSTLLLQPLSDLHFNASYGDAYSRKASLPTLFALMGVAAFILLIAAVNFINMSTAQSVQRFKEIGIRKVLGGRRINLVIQFLIETFILTCIAVTLSVLLVNPVLSLFHAFIPPGLEFHPLAPSTLLFLAALTLLTSLLAGFYPARVLSSYLPVISLKGEGALNVRQNSYLRKSLIVFQFTIALLFIIGSWIIGDQIRFFLNQDMGFNKTAVININAPGGKDNADKKKVLTQEIAQLPEVSMISYSEGTPAAKGHRGTELDYNGKDGKTKTKVSADMLLVNENYIALYEMKLLAGRNLLHSDSMTEVVLNESAAKGLGFKNPADAIGNLIEVGQKDRRDMGSLPVVGVIADFHSRSLREAVGPVFLTSNSKAISTLSIRLTTTGSRVGGIKTTLTAMEKYWKELYPDKKFEYTFFDETIAAFYDKEQKTAQIMRAAMIISIFISCMGLFGVTTFMTAQRTREIGIRKVLGASVSGIVQLLSKDFVWLVGIAILIASPIAWYFMHQWLQGFAYRITISAWVFIGSGLTALIIAMATVSIQATRAARANPVDSLKSE